MLPRLIRCVYMDSFKLPAELRDALLAYLRSRPYAEVVDGVRALESLDKITEAPLMKSVTDVDIGRG